MTRLTTSNSEPHNSRPAILCGLLITAIVGLLLAAPSSASAATFTVNSTADTVDASPGNGVCADAGGACTLRAAVMEASATSGADTIVLPAGTYTLTRGPFDDEFTFSGADEGTGDLDVLNGDLTINGAGAASTIINGGAIDRVFDVNNAAGSGVAVNLTLNNLTITNGDAKTDTFGFFHAGGAIQFDGLDYFSSFTPANVTLTISNCIINGNRAAGVGGGIAVFNGGLLNVSGSTISNNQTIHAQGGGIMYDGAPDPGVRTMSITGSSFSNNQATDATFGSGGGLWSNGNASQTIENNSFSGNQAGTTGGGIFADSFLASNTKAINKNQFTGNSAKQGGGIFNRNGALTLNFNLIVGNTASTDPTSTGFRQGGGGSIVSSANDWWGCNQGPSVLPCDRASGSTGFGITAWLTLSHTATPNSININQPTTLQADFFTNNLGAAIAPADLVALNGRTVTFNNAVLGTISGADPTIQNGKANATFTAGGSGGAGSADATVDHATVTALITISEPATVQTNPTDQTVCDGASVSFTASASGFPTPTVQWQVSTGGPFSDIPGATSTTLTLTATAAQNGNQYRAVFTNSGGTATTTAATLTVNTAPAITTNPTSQTVCEGATVTFTAAASGSPAPTVQWQVSSGGPFTDIPGATSTTLSFTATTAQSGNQYRAVFTNSCGTATTTAATLTVNANTTATALSDQTVCQGATANFSTTATGTDLHYAWTVDGVAFGGDTSSISVPTGSLSTTNHPVSVTVTGACGTVVRSATLTVNANTTASALTDQTVCQGGTANFSTTATGTDLHYAWTVDGVAFGGDTSSISVPTGSMSTGNHPVSVTVTGACGTEVRNATLTVNAPATTTDPPDQTVCQGVTANFSTTAGGTGPFSYAWTLDGSPVGGNSPNVSIPTGSLTVGNHTVSVTTTGACGTASQSATLTVNANTSTTDPPDRSVCQGATTTFTTVASGTGPFTYVWKQGATVLTTGSLGGRVTITSFGNTSTLTINNIQLSDAGSYTVETTGACSTASQTATLTVNNTPPGIVLNGINIQLWPPNHSYHTINVTDLVASASSCDGTVNLNSVVIDYVTSDEVENGNGDGNTLNDIVINCNRKSVQLRSERDGSSNGRVYTLHFKVTDSFGNVATATATVTVPKNQNGSPAVDSGVHYTVTNATCP